MVAYPRMEFAPETYARHVASMDRTLQRALADTVAWDGGRPPPLDHSWGMPLDKDGWRIYSRTLVQPEGQQYVCTGRLHTTLDALRAALYTERTAHYRAVAAVLYECALLDAAVLNVSLPRTVADPGQFFGVKVLKLQINPVVGDLDRDQHDFVFLEFACTRQDRMGRPVYCVVTEPVSIPDKSKVEANLSVETLSTVKLYRDMGDGNVAVTIKAHIHAAARKQKAAPATMVFWKDMGVYLPRSLTKDLMSVTREAFAFQAVLLTTGTFAMTFSKNNKVCSVCCKGAGLLKRHGHCQHCGEAMCNACTVKLYCVDRPSRKVTDKLMLQEKFCKQCFVEAKTLRQRSHRSGDDCSSVRGNDTVIYLDGPLYCPSDESSRSASVVGSSCSSHDETYSSSVGSMGVGGRKGSVVSTSSAWTSSLKDDAVVRKTGVADIRAPKRAPRRSSAACDSAESSWSSSTKNEMAQRIDEMHASIAHQTHLISSMNQMLVQPRRGYAGAPSSNPYVYQDLPPVQPLQYHELQAESLLPSEYVADAAAKLEMADDRRRYMVSLLPTVLAVLSEPTMLQRLQTAHRAGSSPETTPEACKDRGNALFKTHHFKEAIAAFSEGLRLLTISTTATAELQSILFTNRCASWQALGSWEYAFMDATRAIGSYPPYAKGWFRRAKVLEACIGADPALAAKLCRRVRDDTSPATLARTDLSMAQALVEAPATIDPFAAVTPISLPPPPPVLAQYHEHVVVASSADAGRFLQATRPIAAGTMLLQEAPLAIASLQGPERCAGCLAPCENPVPCDHCTRVQFCGAACAPGHRLECPWALDPPAQLQLRLADQFAEMPPVAANDAACLRSWTRRDVFTLKGLVGAGAFPEPLEVHVAGLLVAIERWAIEPGCVALCVDGEPVGYAHVTRPTVVLAIGVTTAIPPTAVRAWLEAIARRWAEPRLELVATDARVVACMDPTTWQPTGAARFRYAAAKLPALERLQDDVASASPVDLVRRVVGAAALAVLARPSDALALAARLVAVANRVPINQLAITACVTVPGGEIVGVGQARVASGLFPAMAMCNHSCQPNASVQFVGQTLRLVATRAVAQGDEIAISYGPHKSKMATAARRAALQEQYGFRCTCAACEGDDDEDAWAPFLATSRRHQAALAAALDRAESAEELLPLTQAMVAARRQALPPGHAAIAEALDLVARVLATTGDFNAAGDACAEAIAVLERLYEPLDAELGHECFKAAQLYFNAGRWTLAREFSARAAAALALHLPPSDPAREELAAMQRYLASLVTT
ncbi:SET and MYND domain-containing protein 4 [Achlya hypogyna]|uniref:SET and MYND domain-containing protein 4 n=1 Tax=Achlya hypogyna TaxID=1202772 RepID=A0A1V9YH19_ACHHY|nr:SET and MYND domain-containing protein 4 [Achlya hypogyna]